MPDYEYCVSLSITHPNIKPSEVTTTLGIAPSKSHGVGEQRKSYKGDTLPGKYQESLWVATLHSEARLTSKQMTIESYLLSQNKNFQEFGDYFGQLVKSGGYVEYFLGWFGTGSINMSASLSRELLSSTAALNIAIGLDVYPE